MLTGAGSMLLAAAPLAASDWNPRAVAQYADTDFGDAATAYAAAGLAETVR